LRGGGAQATLVTAKLLRAQPDRLALLERLERREARLGGCRQLGLERRGRLRRVEITSRLSSERGGRISVYQTVQTV
jgi:hypothetical protein